MKTYHVFARESVLVRYEVKAKSKEDAITACQEGESYYSETIDGEFLEVESVEEVK